MNAFNPLFLLAGVTALLTAQADGQGTLLLNNYDSAKGVWLIQNGATNPAPAGTMVQVLGGPDTNHLAPVTNTVGVSLYTIAAGDANALGAGTGSFFDYGFGNVTGTTTNGTGMLQVLAWYGAATYAQATIRGATVAWSQTLGGQPPLPGLPTPTVLAMPAKLYMTSPGGAPTGSTNGAGGGQQVPLSDASYGCELWLEAERGTNALLLILHNTLPLQTYSVWSIGDLTQTNWALETNVTSSCGSATETTIPMNGRSELFLRASGLSACDTNFVFKGLAHWSNNVEVVPAIVPDTMGAVGPNHFVELLNGKIAVYDKCGTVITQTYTTNFFALTNGDTLDGRILYDAQSNRWVACAIHGGSGGSGNVTLAVSKGDDPSNLASGWNNYLAPVARSGQQSDSTTLGVDANGVYLRVLHYGSASGQATNAGHTLVAMKKSQLYQGTFAPTMLELTNGLSLQIWTIVPAVNFDPVATNGYAWFVGKGPPDWSNTNNPGGPLCYRKLQWQGANAVWADTNWTVLSNTAPTYQNYYDLDGTNITVDSTGGPVFAPDPGSTNTISLNIVGSRLTPTVIRAGFLWTCQAVGLKGTNGTYVGGSSYTNVDRTGIQWLRFQVDANGGTLAFTNNGRIYDPAATNAMYYYVPSLMVNGNGDMLMGFSGSSVSNYISAYYSWRLGSGSMLAQPGLIQSGSKNYDSFLWGDYSATTLDPADDWTFWTVQAYADGLQTRRNPWATVVGRILLPP